jgi:hypothetical protein
MKRDLMAWLKSAKYLPDFMRDFHDQKDLFKTIHELVSEHDGTKAISWRDAHIYTIDVFLWFMARRGYTLQRSRVKCDFLDIHQTIADQTEKRRDAFASTLKAVAEKGQNNG